MVAHKKVFADKNIRFGTDLGLIKCLKQVELQILRLTCAPIIELPPNISRMPRRRGQGSYFSAIIFLFTNCGALSLWSSLTANVFVLHDLFRIHTQQGTYFIHASFVPAYTNIL